MENDQKLYLVRMTESGKLCFTDVLTEKSGVAYCKEGACTILRSYGDTVDAAEVVRDYMDLLEPQAARGRGRGGVVGFPGTERRRRQVQDPAGNSYSDIRAMCEAYHISAQTYYGRLRRGMTQEEALNTPGRVQNSGSCTDHLGNEFKDIKAMCTAYQISQNQFYIRRRAGLTLEQILTGSGASKRAITVGGVSYASKRALCQDHGVSYQRFLILQGQGMTQEEALEHLLRARARREEKRRAKAERKQNADRKKPQKPKKQKAPGVRSTEDHKGNVYPSQKAMCDAYGIQYQTFRQRIRSGYDLEAALCMQTARPGRPAQKRPGAQDAPEPEKIVRRIPKAQNTAGPAGADAAGA